MFDHLSTQAQLALSQAEAVAHRLAHDYLGTEHLLAGLAYTDEPGARRVLADCGVDGPAVEAHLETTLGRGRQALSVRPPFTASATVVLARSRWEARAFGHDAVGSAHLLLALVRHTDSAAITVLQALGVDLTKLEAMLVEVAPHDGSPERPKATDGPEATDGPDGSDGSDGSDGGASIESNAAAEVAGSDAVRPSFDDEPLAIQVVRLTHQLARLERQVAELTARLDGQPPP